MQLNNFAANRFISTFLKTLERSILVWNRPLAAIILSGLIYAGISSTAGAPWRLSSAPYYNLLADAFLHGQLHLRVIPENTIDLSLFQGQYYLYWGPLPALLALPWVAFFGIHASDVLQTLLVSAVNIGLFVLVIQSAVKRGVIRITPVQQALLTIFLALGTAYIPYTLSGHVWQMVQMCSITCTFLAYLSTFRLENRKAFFFTGLGVAGILLTRPSAIFNAVFLAYYLLNRHWKIDKGRLFNYCFYGVLPVVAALIFTAVYNYLRFGNVLENGLSYHLMGPYYAAEYSKWGIFNIHFIPENFFYTYLFYPFSFFPPGITVRSGSLFLLSPLFFWAIYAIWERRRKIITWVLLASILLTNIPLMLLFGPLSTLFGPRYTLDFIIPLLLLTALGMEKLRVSYASLLVILSIIHYLFGSLIYVRGVP